MKKREIKTFSILMMMVAYIIIYRIFIINNHLKYIESLNASIMMVLLALAIYLFAFQKDKLTVIKKQVIIITGVEILAFFAISYTAGLFVGFLKNAYSITTYSIINNIFAPIILIICTELLRYTIIKPNQHNKKIVFIITFILIIFELFTTVRTVDFKSVEQLFKLVVEKILPITIKNSVLSYLTLKVGYKPPLVYRIIMDLYIYIMPVVPNFGDYINSMIAICMPFVLYIFSSRIINEYYNGTEYEFKSTAFQIADIPIIAFILIIVALVSGYFPYYLIGIGSESMNPKIYKGDAVFVKKVASKKELKVGYVIVYKNKGEQIVHRLVEIEKVGNKVYYRTKGDNNNTVDNINIEYKDIQGIVQFKIPYVAKPSIYLSEHLDWRNKKA